MTEAAGVIACGCSKHLTAAIVRSSATKKDNKTTKPEIRNRRKEQAAGKNKKKKSQNKIETETEVKEGTLVTAESQKQKTPKKLDEPYREVLACP